MVLQSLILSKDRFSTLDAARKWVADHNFKTSFEGKPPDETSTSYRFRQADPTRFAPKSFRTIELDNGVKGVVGKLKGSSASTRTRKDLRVHRDELHTQDSLFEILDLLS